MILFLAVIGGFCLGIFVGFIWASWPYRNAVKRLLEMSIPNHPENPGQLINTAFRLGFRSCLDDLVEGYLHGSAPKKGGQP